MKADDPRHGTNAGFFAHGRQDEAPCAACYVAKNRHLKVLRTYGQQRLTTLGREAFTKLQVMPQGVLHELTGTSGRILRNLRDGTPDSRVTKSVKRRILSAPLLTDVGVTRKLQALAALGWSIRELAARSGLNATVISKRRSSVSTDYIETRTVLAVDRLYRELCMTPAPIGGPSKQAIARAERMGWAPPLAWNEIDDPEERPHGARNDEPARKTDYDAVVVDRILAGDPKIRATKAERHEVIRRWPDSIYALEQLRPDWNLSRDLREMRAELGEAS